MVIARKQKCSCQKVGNRKAKKLLSMLDYKKGNELKKSNKISYMSIQRKEFTERFVLPLPTQV